VSHSRLDATLRFSQPLSGYLAQPEVRGLISCRNRSWDLPSECSPREDRRPLSRPASSPAVIHPRAATRRPRLITDRFCRLPRFRALAWLPRPTMPALSTDPKASFPDALGLGNELAAYRELHLLRSVPPLTSPFSTDASCPSPAADTLLGFFPSRVFSDHALKPRTRPSPKARTRPLNPKTQSTRPEGLPRPRKIASPPGPGGTCPSTEAREQTPSAVSDPCVRPARTTPRWPLLLP